jgi:hypothetical protein
MCKELRVIIAGGRDFKDYDLLSTTVYDLISPPHVPIHEKTKIISGTAKGADRLGEQFAALYNIPIKRFPANWTAYGKRAGAIRNADMAKYDSEDDCYGMLIAFWDGKSKGTKNMIDIAERYGLDVHIIRY